MNNIPNVKIDGIDVVQVDHAKRLGINISHDLSWNKHEQNVVKMAGGKSDYIHCSASGKRAEIGQTDVVTV